MTNEEYSIAYTEVLEILKFIPEEDYNKIPKGKIELFETYASKNYNFEYNPNKALDNQNVSKITKGIIAILFRDYWATETQKNKIIAKQNYDRKILEEQKRAKYNPNDIFKRRNNFSTMNEPESKPVLQVSEDMKISVVSKGKWYNKIIKLFIKFFKKQGYK